jgi:hypothetical protein
MPLPNWKVIYSASFLILLGILYLSLTPFGDSAPGVKASVVWGTITLVLSLIFMLGAAQTPLQFLVFFASGSFGAGMGYLVGAWLTPTGDSNPLDQVRNIAAGVLTGVVGTKLLALWDDLVNPAVQGGTPRIMTAPFFVPIALWFVGFTVSLSAFYTVRSAEAGEVRITYSPHGDVNGLGGNHIGIPPATTIQFAGAANSPEDVTIEWSFHLDKPCAPPRNGKTFDKSKFQMVMEGAFVPASGALTTPAPSDLEEFFDSCPGSQNWILTATSKQNRSKTAAFEVMFCRTNDECNAKAVAPAKDEGKTADKDQAKKSVGK